VSSHRPRRRFGQHFLTNPRILSRIVEALDPAPGQAVLEIGPGQGALTAELVGAAHGAIELDRDRCLAREVSESISSGTHASTGTRCIAARPGFLLTGTSPQHHVALLDQALSCARRGSPGAEGASDHLGGGARPRRAHRGPVGCGANGCSGSGRTFIRFRDSAVVR
jgi:hypothetical protein